MLTPADMPSPTDAARVLQHKQYELLHAMYDAWNQAHEALGFKDYEAASRDPTFVTARAAYDASVVELEAMLGEQAHCNEVDCDLFSLYSDLYKDDSGFRPRHHITRAGVKAYLDKRPTHSDC